MKDLILRMRSEILKRNLEELRKKVDNPPLSKRFQNIEASCDEVWRLMNAIQDKLYGLSKAARTSGLPEQMKSDLRQITRGYEDMADSFQKVQQEAGKLVKASAYNVGDKVRPDVVGKDCANQLGSILTALNAVPPDLGEAWKTYQTRYAEAQNLLSEYLEFMGGLAVRDAGFDDGICNYADELIALVVGPTSPSMAIPSRQETIRMTWARIVRMACPEWTLWALPLTAHDVWYMTAQETLRAQGKAGDFDHAPKWMQDCLADAYAVWSAGPAYAYAAFFLRLDPFCPRAEGDKCNDDLRAQAILKMWELMDQEDAGNLHYKVYRDDLKEEWQNALLFTDPGRSKDAEGRPDFPVDAEKKAGLDQKIPALFLALKKYGFSGFSLQNWAAIQEWPPKLLNRETINSAEADFRWVLNAAWIARIRNPGQASVIEEGARRLWNNITERNRSSGELGGRASRQVAGRS
jgi:hypothetical protein